MDIFVTVLSYILVASLGALLGFIILIGIGKKKAHSGTIKVIKDENKVIYSLELDEDPTMLEHMSEVVFKIETPDESSNRKYNLLHNELYRRRKMFRDKEIPRHQRMLEEEYVRTLAVLRQHQANSEEYATLLSNVERIHKMMDIKNPSPVSRETLLAVGANILGILLIIKHEDVNVITSKALGFVIRVR